MPPNATQRAITPDTWTPADEAVRVGISLRRLRDLLKANPELPVLRNGNRVLFDEIAHAALKEVMRCRNDSRQGSGSSHGRARRSSISAAPSAGNAFMKALALTTVRSPKKPAPPAKLSSTVLPFTKPRRG
jgi:hypothetical protein